MGDSELAALLASFGRELELAFNSFPEGNSPAHKRKRYILALRVIAKFFRASPGSPNLSRCFFELATALRDLNYGVVDPLLKPSSSQSGDATAEWCKRATAASQVRLLVLDGLTRKEAGKKVAEELRKKPSSILSWYDEFRKPAGQSKIKNPIARSIFDDHQQLFSVERRK
jgi:hypothetical protein